MIEIYHLLVRVARRLLRISTRSATGLFYLTLYYLVELPSRPRTRRYEGSIQSDSGLWCILAMRRGKLVSENLLTFLRCLRDSGYNVILTNNGLLSLELLRPFMPYCHTVISKSRGGRDFGSYQYATNYLRGLSATDSITQVIYCNDSIFIKPSSLRRLLAKMAGSQADYIGLTETFEFNYHVSSWFFAVSGENFSSPAFEQFWAKYRPVSSRVHSIDRGEIGLTRAMLRNATYPDVLFTGKTVVDVCFNCDLAELATRLTQLSGLPMWQRLKGEMEKLAAIEDNQGIVVAVPVLRRLVQEQAEFQNNMMAYNLFLLDLCDFPFLKKDLVFREQYLVGQIENVIETWTGEDREHVAEIRGLFRARGAARWLVGMQRYLTRDGQI